MNELQRTPERLKLLKGIARNFLGKPIHSFDGGELAVLKTFFTDTGSRVFFVHNLPQAMGDALLAMYSRMKNPRGVRGVFVDSFLPQLLATQLRETEEKYKGDAALFIRRSGIKNLADFTHHSEESARELHKFLAFFSPRYLSECVREYLYSPSPNEEKLGRIAVAIDGARVDDGYLKKLCSSEKVRKFLSTWLDKYGHNSIARMVGGIWICLENISLLAAKAVEENRPGSGFIELSTRYVDMSGKDCYPIWNEFDVYGIPSEAIRRKLALSFDLYRELQGENFDGPFPEFLRDRWGNRFSDARDLENGVIGETCDVLGNFLPAATLTSVGAALSGEAFPELIRHLRLTGTPECDVLADMIAEESAELGYDQFIAHADPTDWQAQNWEYLDEETFPKYIRSGIFQAEFPSIDAVSNILLSVFRRQKSFSDCAAMENVVRKLKNRPRGAFDKLPRAFEATGGNFSGVMSFRGWRDLQRQGFSTHHRTLLTTRLGFYRYDKPAPMMLGHSFGIIREDDLRATGLMDSRFTPAILQQYPLSIGNIVGFTFGANLRQLEFCNWQRSKFGVNHEVRQLFLGMDDILATRFPWWKEISRVDSTSAYVFARTNEGVPLFAK